MNPSTLQQDWFIEEKQKIEGNKKFKNQKRKRQYLHFDKRISNLTLDGIKNVWNPTEVSRHSFYPFIRFVKKLKKYSKTKTKISFKPKERPIDFAAHYDASIYSWYSFLLSLKYEDELKARNLSDIPIAYRKIDHKSNLEFAADIISFIKKHPNYEVMTFDVEKFFENIDHIKLKQQWAKLLKMQSLPIDHYQVFKSLTNYHYAEMEQLHRRFEFTLKEHSEKQQVCSSDEFRTKVCQGGLLKKNSKVRKDGDKEYRVGIPQGSSISCLLANLYMIDFDQEVSQLVSSLGGLYRRYSDDIIVVIPKGAISDVEWGVVSASQKVDLNLHKDKREKRHFITQSGRLICVDSESKKISTLQYLGIQFDGEDVYLRHAGIAKFQRRRSRTVKHTITTLKKGRHVPMKMYLQKFTRHGKDNYLAYADRAKAVFPSPKMKKQLSPNRVAKQLKKRIKKFNEDK